MLKTCQNLGEMAAEEKRMQERCWERGQLERQEERFYI